MNNKYKKIVNKVLCVIAAISVFFINTPVYAQSLSPAAIIIDEGFTEDNIHYVLYKTSTSDSISPKIVVSKVFKASMVLDGNVIPPSTWNTSMTEDGITYSGTLYLQSYEFDNFFASKKTIAHYSGTLYARI